MFTSKTQGHIPKLILCRKFRVATIPGISVSYAKHVNNFTYHPHESYTQKKKPYNNIDFVRLLSPVFSDEGLYSPHARHSA